MVRKVSSRSEPSVSTGIPAVGKSKPSKKRSLSAPVNLDEYQKPNPHCTACPLHSGVQHVCVGGESSGGKPYEIVIVGEAPGAEEDKRNRPFIGPSGKLLRAELARAGIESYYVTNAVKCVVGSTSVRTPTPPSVGYRRYYKGPLISLKTSRGYELTVTPNHPVLTLRGWVPVQDLRCFEDFVYSTDAYPNKTVQPEIDNVPATAEQIFRSMYETNILSRVIGSKVDFHSDGSPDYEVEIVRANSHLLLKTGSSSKQFCSEPLITVPSSTQSTRGFFRGTPYALSNSSRRPQFPTTMRYITGRLRHFPSLFDTETFPILSYMPYCVGFNSCVSVASSFIPPRLQSTSDYAVTYTKHTCDLRKRLPRDVSTDQIVSIDYQRGAAHVYNFSTSEEWYYSNNIITHNCRPPDNRKPTPAEIKACRPYLDAELAQLKPKYVVTAGAIPSKLLLKEAKITQAHGKIKPMLHWVGYPIFHPAYILRDPTHLPNFRHDLKRLVREMKGDRPENNIEWEIVTPENIKQLLAEYAAAPEFSFDTETTSLFPYDQLGHIRCLGVALPHKTWVIPGQMPGHMFWDNPESFAELVMELEVQQKRTEKVSVTQHGKFDNQWTQIYCYANFFLDFDVGLAHHLLDENSDHDLKYLARAYLDAPEYDIPGKDKANPDLSTPEKRRAFMEYCAKDAHYTLRLRQLLNAELRKDHQLHRLYYRLVMPAARALADIEQEGLYLNQERYAQVTEHVKADRQKALADLHKSAGEVINWNSPEQVGRVLQKLSLPLTIKTPGGKYSTSEAAIVGLKGKHRIIDQLLHYRELDKILGTYLEGWKKYIHKDKLYLSYKQHGTVGGRFSSRLHSIPTDSDIRSIIDAPPGWRFVAADLSQAELRIAAEMSQDLQLCNAYRKGDDVHWNTLLYMVASGSMPEYTKQTIKTANALEAGHFESLTAALAAIKTAGHKKCTAIWDGWKEGRTRAKRITFGFIYGMYENTFCKKMLVDYDWPCTWNEAHSYRNGFFELYSGLPKWHDRCKQLARLDGHVRSWWGRIRRLPATHSSNRELRGEAERQAINIGVQSCMGDWKTGAMIEIHDNLPRDQLRIVGEHHDALLMIVRNGCEAKALPVVRTIMEKPALLNTFKIKMSVPMKVEINVGPWGAGQEWAEGL